MKRILTINFNRKNWYVDSGPNSHSTSITNKNIVVMNKNTQSTQNPYSVNLVTKTDSCEFQLPYQRFVCAGVKFKFLVCVPTGQ